MDSRDTLTWVAIELSGYGEQKVEDGEIESLIRHDLGVTEDFPIFVPAATYRKNERVITVHLLEGYVFVGAGLPETKYFALENRGYVTSVMSSASGPHKIRTLSVLPNSEIERLRSQLRKMISAEIEVGAKVKVLDGRYRKLDGEVIGEDGPEKAFVRFRLRSWERIASIPRVFLETIDK